MMAAAIGALKSALRRDDFWCDLEAINCHYNYVAKERHFGKDVWLTRKGAVSAREGELGIIPGSMGAKSFIVRGKGNRESLCWDEAKAHPGITALTGKQIRVTIEILD
jgi:tRNA-splicing ligase RtcB